MGERILQRVDSGVTAFAQVASGIGRSSLPYVEATDRAGPAALCDGQSLVTVQPCFGLRMRRDVDEFHNSGMPV